MDALERDRIAAIDRAVILVVARCWASRSVSGGAIANDFGAETSRIDGGTGDCICGSRTAAAARSASSQADSHGERHAQS